MNREEMILEAVRLGKGSGAKLGTPASNAGKFHVGQVVDWTGDRVRILSKNNDLYEIEHENGNVWIGDDIPESELKPLA